MNAKRVIVLCSLLTILFVPACGRGESSGITVTPMPAHTATPLPTHTPTAKPSQTPTHTPIPPTPTLDKGIQNPENGHWYLVLPSMVWSSARDRCSSLGGHLVTIDDASEDRFVYNSVYRPNGGPGIFLGATDRDKEGRWVWVTGEKLRYTNWASGEPNNCGYHNVNQPCGSENTLTYHEDHPGQWNDVPDGMGRYICEFED